MKTLQKDGRTLQREDIYLDLSKLSEEEIKSIPNILEKAGESFQQKPDTLYNLYLAQKKDTGRWEYFLMLCNRTEITYPDFLQLFGESELTELPEKWYIRGSEELKEYFRENRVDLIGDHYETIYYKDGEFWDCDDIDEIFEIEKYTEITVADYKRLGGSAENAHTENPVCSKMETTETCKESLQVEFEGEKQGFKFTDEYLKEALEKRGYFVFPKAPEGEFPDLTDFPGVEMNVRYDDNPTEWYNTSVILKRWNYFIDENFDYPIAVRPIQKQTITPTELFERLSKYEDLSNYEKPQ